jgi:type IV secretory pathway VirB2 component (pilin)
MKEKDMKFLRVVGIIALCVMVLFGPITLAHYLAFGEEAFNIRTLSDLE